MRDRIARALRALANRVSPPRPIVIRTTVNLDGKAIADAVDDDYGRGGARR